LSTKHLNSNTPYPHLFSPLQIGSVSLPNRCIMGSMHTGLEEKWSYKRLAAYFAERAQGGVGLIITGGISPNWVGKSAPFAAKLSNPIEVMRHRTVTDAVHRKGGKIVMQILHTGRYAYHPFLVAPSPIKAPISKYVPKALSTQGVKKQIHDFIRCARLAKKAGYDGVEVMGSEGYFINEFLCTRTNKRIDEFGGSFENRMRVPIEIVRGIRDAVGPDFLIIYRLSLMDLVPEGNSFEEVMQLAKAIEKVGANMINSGIGWHEARIPTIAAMVPQGAFAFATRGLKAAVTIPVIATNRINTPAVAEKILAEGAADFVCMARPFLADPAFVKKAQAGQAQFINTCIACNQACLDHIFEGKIASCLVNPKACHETKLIFETRKKIKKIAVVGAGPAGLSFTLQAAEKGHDVFLYEANDKIGGQFNLAKEIPGKEDFAETLRYFEKSLAQFPKVSVHLNQLVTAEFLLAQGFDEIVIATGVIYRKPQIEGIEHEKVLTYAEAITQRKTLGKYIAIIGAGGIGFDVAQALCTPSSVNEKDLSHFCYTWGIDETLSHPGALVEAESPFEFRKIYLLQRSTEKMGKYLGKTTGWIHRLFLKKYQVEMLSGVRYDKIDNKGLHITLNDKPKILYVDHVIICAGQLSEKHLYNDLSTQKKIPVHLIGGAFEAKELDAKRAIEQGVTLGLKI
jgi:2,4-dienoyl-CoA reductase (NADPH2)